MRRGAKDCSDGGTNANTPRASHPSWKMIRSYAQIAPTVAARCNSAAQCAPSPAFFPHRFVLLLRQHLLIRRPKIAVQPAHAIGARHPPPQLPARGGASRPYQIGRNLPCLAAQSYPNPAFARFLQDQRPHFIQFQDGAFRVLRVWPHERCA